ncbi:homeobox-leucine zipper protein HOX11-like [Zingiber officinale]|uniref:homeobox-leucine zipper protein HOX11-like n=1 Tax=Zingiber officinale TaxID=94328 RepID=UPI001C4D1240|nr:homeobox-leucine zipper protein HOX11-like [Zingiber officinale]
MELGLRLGEAPAGRPFWAAEPAKRGRGSLGLVLGMGLGVGRCSVEEVQENEDAMEEKEMEGEVEVEEEEEEEEEESRFAEPALQLNLLPLLPLSGQPSSSQLRFPWASETGTVEASMRGFDVNRAPSVEEADGGAAASSSPNSTVSSFQMEFSAARCEGGAPAAERASSRVSDEEENGLGRKKLRLSKEQSAFLEESFKEHNTLNPKQKLALAKQLNLRPRQVEVWFQNRRARTKLKQTEVDCEYLKRCCQTLTEENRRLQKEVAELRALKTSHPFYMHLPATTLSMCPSCERVASTTTAAANSASATTNGNSSDRPQNSFAALFSKPRPFPLGAAAQPSSAAPRQPSPVS